MASRAVLADWQEENEHSPEEVNRKLWQGAAEQGWRVAPASRGSEQFGKWMCMPGQLEPGMTAIPLTLLHCADYAPGGGGESFSNRLEAQMHGAGVLNAAPQLAAGECEEEG